MGLSPTGLALDLAPEHPLKDGALEVPSQPGLGFELDGDALLEARTRASEGAPKLVEWSA